MTLKTAKSTTALLVFSFAVLFASGIRVGGQAAASDEQQLRALESNYMKAVDTLDPELISTVWSHGPGVSFIHPRGTAVGFEQIREGFYRDTMGLFSQRDLTLENPVLHVYNGTAWAEMTWTFHATLKDGQKITTTGRETQIYSKESGGWRIVHVHYSGPPVTGALKGF
ncbi:MAG TPA: nuclear transport factor 2 family protein [Terracidiphilus sp.]|nr:nuclear transport factor 2 family protein [Terracidiphilus sp.]